MVAYTHGARPWTVLAFLARTLLAVDETLANAYDHCASRLKSTSNWHGGEGTDDYGFTALAAGIYISSLYEFDFQDCFLEFIQVKWWSIQVFFAIRKRNRKRLCIHRYKQYVPRELRSLPQGLICVPL